MKTEFDLSIMPAKLTNFLEIQSESFGKVKIYYYIRLVNNVKLLRYKIDECPAVYDIIYTEIEQRNITLHEYFRNVLNFLHLQLKEVGDNKEFRSEMTEDDQALFNYLESRLSE